MSIIGTLFFAWFLTLFNLDTILIAAVNEIFGTNYSTNVYWLTAFLIAVIGTPIEMAVRHNSKKRNSKKRNSKS